MHAPRCDGGEPGAAGATAADAEDGIERVVNLCGDKGKTVVNLGVVPSWASLSLLLCCCADRQRAPVLQVSLRVCVRACACARVWARACECAPALLPDLPFVLEC